MRWATRLFDDLSLRELYDLLALRQRVFAIEQQSLYLDLDGRDLSATHVLGHAGGILSAYARFFAPGVRYAEASVGRVVVAPALRGSGAGRELVRTTLAELERAHGSVAVRISAQSHLQRFYREFAFVREGDDYDEDGIPHVAMVRPPP